MASGAPNVKINTQERAVSTDVNRLQKKGASAWQEIWRYLMMCTTTDDLDAGGNVVEVAAGGTPLAGKIFNGYEVHPQTGVGQLSLQISDGAALVLVNDLDADSSQFKYATDRGITSNGVLLMTANPSGSVRIDVVEVQWSDVVTETDNRDIFNTTTGLFAPASVTKGTAGTLIDGGGNVRVRLGTPGSGYPGNVSGWMPLAVAYVPAGATQCDDMDFWDVRPLVEDKLHNLTDASSNLQRSEWLVGAMNSLDNGAQTIVTGKVEASIGTRRVGGRMLSSIPGIDANAALDAQAAANQDGGSFPSAGLWFLYLATPFNLPRWARYTRTGPRVPRSPRGLPIVTSKVPTVLGAPNVALPIPAAMGLGGTTTSAVCVAASFTSSSNPLGGVFDGKVFYPEAVQYFAAASFDNNSVTFNLVDNTTHPANARAVHVVFDITVQAPAGPAALSATATLTNNGLVLLGTPVTPPGGSALAVVQPPTMVLANPDTNPHAIEVVVPARIPLFSNYPSGSGITRALKWVHNIASAAFAGVWTVSGARVRVVGWELGNP